jgi:rhodanese-related sulfurtransferase
MGQAGPLTVRSAQHVREALVSRRELALLDVRPEHEHAQGHPLFAASLPFDRLELEVLDRVPDLGAPVVVLDGGEGTAALAERQLSGLGYLRVSMLEGGIAAWSNAGYELFGDVNAPSKAFGELVASRLRVPFIRPDRLYGLVRDGGDVAVVDVRRYEEYATMNIPTGRSAPGVEVVLRAPEAAPRGSTLLVLNCAGRTRGIIATQSLRNVGIANPVAALENGTIGWKLAGLELGTGASAQVPSPVDRSGDIAAAARRLADRAGVRRTSLVMLQDRATRSGPDRDRTRYYFDVRDRDEYLAGHAAGSRWAPGGQLVQETDFYAPVRGAEILLADDDGTRANVTGSWLAQMGWDVAVVDDALQGSLETGPWLARPARVLAAPGVPAEVCAGLLAGGTARVVEVGPLAGYRARHLPGSAWAQRGDLALRPKALLGEAVRSLVLVSENPAAAGWAWATLPATWAARTVVLEGGKAAWANAGLSFEAGAGEQLSGPDAYRRPYEGTSVGAATMQAYIDWELGLVAQLERDGTHNFWVIEP